MAYEADVEAHVDRLDDDVEMILRMIIQFVMWSRGDRVDMLVTR